MNKQSLLLSLLLPWSFGCTQNLHDVTPTPSVPSPVVPVSGNQSFQLHSEEPPELTLSQALVLTLDKSPELKSFSHSVRASEAKILQAGLSPNPELSVAVEDVLGSGNYDGGKQAQTTLQLSQLIELGGKRSSRIEVAEAARDQVSTDYEIKKVEVLTSLTDKFIRTVADEHLLRLAQKGAYLAKEALQNIRSRAKAGGVSELEEAKAKVILSRAHIASEHAEHQFLSSKRELASFWGNDTPIFSKLSANLFEVKTLPGYENLLLRVDESLEAKKWITEKRLKEAEQRLAEAKSVPDLLLGAGPRRIEGSDDSAWVFQVSLPLTIFNRNQGERQEASVLTDKAITEGEVSRLRLKTALFGLYQEASHEHAVLEAMKSEIIPEAERSLAIAQAGYDQGRYSYLDLLDAQRTLLEVYREHIEAAYLFHSFINSIERLVGVPLNTGSLKTN